MGRAALLALAALALLLLAGAAHAQPSSYSFHGELDAFKVRYEAMASPLSDNYTWAVSVDNETQSSYGAGSYDRYHIYVEASDYEYQGSTYANSINANATFTFSPDWPCYVVKVAAYVSFTDPGDSQFVEVYINVTNDDVVYETGNFSSAGTAWTYVEVEPSTPVDLTGYSTWSITVWFKATSEGTGSGSVKVEVRDVQVYVKTDLNDSEVHVITVADGVENQHVATMPDVSYSTYPAYWNECLVYWLVHPNYTVRKVTVGGTEYTSFDGSGTERVGDKLYSYVYLSKPGQGSCKVEAASPNLLCGPTRGITQHRLPSFPDNLTLVLANDCMWYRALVYNGSQPVSGGRCNFTLYGPDGSVFDEELDVPASDGEAVAYLHVEPSPTGTCTLHVRWSDGYYAGMKAMQFESTRCSIRVSIYTPRGRTFKVERCRCRGVDVDIEARLPFTHSFALLNMPAGNFTLYVWRRGVRIPLTFSYHTLHFLEGRGVSLDLGEHVRETRWVEVVTNGTIISLSHEVEHYLKLIVEPVTATFAGTTRVVIVGPRPEAVYVDGSPASYEYVDGDLIVDVQHSLIEVYYATYTLTVNVVDPEGRPIEGAVVKATNRYGESVSATTGRDGRVVFELIPTTWTVEAYVGGVKAASATVELEGDTEITLTSTVAPPAPAIWDYLPWIILATIALVAVVAIVKVARG